jgi:signal transduction histidine kinase
MFCVISICKGDSGRVWVGTYLNGLFEFDPKSGNIIRHLDEHSGLLHDQVQSISKDAAGNLWMVFERGISRYSPKTGAIQNFKAVTILPGENMDATQGLEQSRSGNDRVVFSLDDGIAMFDPKALDANTNPPVVHIEGVTYSNPISDESARTIVPYGINSLNLAYNQNRIKFDYIALHFDDPSQNRYAYKLEGYDKDWIQAGTQRSVTYTNLSPGTYTFRVRACNSDGVWNNKGDSITITIHTSLWMRWWAWLIYIVLFAAAIYAFIAYRSRALKRENQELEEKISERTQQLSNANKELSEQQEEIITQRDRLSETVDELKTTQQQLIQSEKLASLGELTAGIAHEIQNPLNFVNNFSEINMELIDEMREELNKGEKDEVIALSEDIKQNLDKIRHHGKRADAIVKNMLQHSRNNSSQREPTDINALADEYFRLSYHGLRAKDKSFNSEMVTELGENIPKIDVISQDIGRVLLNLFNNAFYAVQQKKKALGDSYKPEVMVSTAINNDYVEIRVKDNGIGIPDAVKEKILQPFFTTKPTGEGTGLGLSLSYDIVVKGHGGKLDIHSREGEGSEFIISLPA